MNGSLFKQKHFVARSKTLPYLEEVSLPSWQPAVAESSLSSKAVTLPEPQADSNCAFLGVADAPGKHLPRLPEPLL